MDLSYRYGLGSSGLNYSPNITNINPSIIIPESYNFNLLANSLKSRGGTEIIYDFDEEIQITSIFQYLDDIFITMQDGRIFLNENVIYTATNQIINATYVIWNENIIICTGSNIPQVFIPDSTQTIDYPTNKMAADWSLEGSYPEIMILHGKGNSIRAWAIGENELNNILYFSDLNHDGESQVPDFSEDTEKASGFLYINLNNDHKLRGIIEFGDKLLLFSDLSSFVINNDPADTTLWSYSEAQWKGGAFSHYAITKVENDVFVFAKDGTIYSITAVVSYGDYRISSITEPASINDYINENLMIEEGTRIHSIFDPTLRIIKFFLARKNQEENHLALVYSIDKSPSTGWIIHHNEEYPSGYNASCSSLILKENNEYVVVTGDYNGKIWELEIDNVRDDFKRIKMQLTTPWVNAEDPRNTKLFKRGFIEMSNISAVNVSVIMNVEGKNPKIVDDLFFKPSLSLFGHAIWDVSVFDGIVEREHIRYNMGRIGVDIQQTFIFKEVDDDDTARFDVSNWDEGIFGNSDLYFSPFYVLSNTIDFMPVAQRLTL